MAITKVSDLNSLYNSIYEDAIFVAREQNIMTNLVKNYSATGWMNRVIPQYAQVTAQSVNEGVDFANPTTFSKTPLATLTPGEVMAQVLLTDRDVETDPDDARQSAATELGNAIATKIDTDLVGLFSGFSSGKGSAGNSLTIAKCAAAISKLRTNKVMNPIYVVLHPYGWHDVWVELGQPAANQAFLGDLANEALKAFFVGQMLAAQWFTSANISIDGSDDAIGAAFNRGALGFDSRKAPYLETERDASRRSTELNMVAGYAYGEVRDDHGIKLTHDATEPTG